MLVQAIGLCVRGFAAAFSWILAFDEVLSFIGIIISVVMVIILCRLIIFPFLHQAGSSIKADFKDRDSFRG